MNNNPAIKAIVAVFMTFGVALWLVVALCFEALRWTAIAILWCLSQLLGAIIAIKKATTKRT